MFFDKFKEFWRKLDKRDNESDRIIARLNRELRQHLSDQKQEKKPLKVLYGPSFSIYTPSYLHDAILSIALRLRGALIVPVYCDSVQTVECSFMGGVWGGGSCFNENCRNCCTSSKQLWKNVDLLPTPFSGFYSADELETIEREVLSLSSDNWIDYNKFNLPFGTLAKDLVVNFNVVGDYRLIPDYERLGKAHLRNLLLTNLVFERIIDKVKPDRVVTNDSYYGMWAILQHICGRRGIPFYSHWSGTRPGAWCYAYNDASMNLDYRRAWPNFSAAPLSAHQRTMVEEWLVGRLSGKDMLLDTASLAPHCTDEVDLTKIKAGKPTALLAANVIWDLAALNKQVVFDDMIDWIAETIAWFGRHPEYQLIVKPHPGEQTPSIPETEERVSIALERRGVIIPGNVAMLTPKSAVTVYQLFPLANVGLMHTTNVGIEMSARGIPVITTARSPYRGLGFTLDPSTRDEYFHTLENALKGEKLPEREQQIDLAYKLILFQQFHYYTKINIMDFKWGETPRLKVTKLDDIRPGKKRHLDYIVDSIVAGLPIVSEDRWPAES